MDSFHEHAVTYVPDMRWFPCFRCGYKGQELTSLIIGYCIAEKLLLCLDLTCLLLLLWQVIFVYRDSHKVKWSDSRINIMLLCILATVYMFIHYGVIPPGMRSGLFFIIEICRLSILFWLCLYYSSRASGLLPNRKYFMQGLKLLFILGLGFNIFLGVWVFGLLKSGALQDKRLCIAW